MTEPSQYFKGRTVQEQMDEVIGYVDKRAEEVAAAKAGAVLQPAEQAKTDAQAAAQQAEAAKDTTLAALPEIRQDISGLKAEDAALDGRLDTVELKVTTAEGNIVTIQGQIVAIENKNTQQDSAIATLQTADSQNVKINNINQYAVGLTGNQRPITGIKACAFVANNFVEIDGFTVSRAGWHKIYTIKSKERWMGVLSIYKNSNDYLLTRACMYEYLIVINSMATAGIYYITRVGNEPQVRLTFDGTVWNVWIQCPAYQRTYIQLDSKTYGWGEYDGAYHVDPDYATVTTEPAVEDYSVYKTPVAP